MKKLLPFLVLSLVTPLASAFAADPLDFPDATLRIQAGAQTTLIRAGNQAREMKIDGKSVRVGDILSNSLKIEWMISPSPEVGDEYVIVVRRQKEKPRTYSAVFKSGYLSLAASEGISIEIEN